MVTRLLDDERTCTRTELAEMVDSGQVYGPLGALALAGGYWPRRRLVDLLLCTVCSLPMPSGTALPGMCSRLCADLAGFFNLEFVSYSTARVLEPLMRGFKDAASPPARVADFFHGVVAEHADVDQLGGRLRGVPSVAFSVPHTNRDRAWSVNQVLWADLLLEWGIPMVDSMGPLDRRPVRRTAEPALYKALPPMRPGMRVVVVDDLWTTGASLGSLAIALHQAGARQVLGLTVGRQLRPDTVATERAYRLLRGESAHA